MTMSVLLRECIDLHEGRPRLRVDRAAGVIRNVKILGWRSANGRDYDPQGVDPALYENRPVNINHLRPGQERSVYDRFGRTVNCVRRADGIYGDLEYLKSHPQAGPVAEAAERMPGVYGLSHVARGHQTAGTGSAYAVESVQSVDLVGDPATVAGLHESRGITPVKTLAAMIEDLDRSRPVYARALREVAEAGIMSPDASWGDPGGAVEDDADGGHEQALLDAAHK